MENQHIYPCSLCQKCFSSAEYLDLHKQQKHFYSAGQLEKTGDDVLNPPQPLIVPIAPQTQGTQKAAELLVPSKPSPIISPPSQHKFECQVCHKSFAQKTRYLRHCKMHQKRLCSLCGAQFGQQSALAQHVWEVHRKTMTDLAFNSANMLGGHSAHLAPVVRNGNYEKPEIKPDNDLRVANPLMGYSVRPGDKLSVSNGQQNQSNFKARKLVLNGARKPRLGFQQANAVPGESNETKTEKSSGADVYDFDANSDEDEVIAPIRTLKQRVLGSIRNSAINKQCVVKNNNDKDTGYQSQNVNTDKSELIQSGPLRPDLRLTNHNHEGENDSSRVETETETFNDPAVDNESTFGDAKNQFAFVESISPTGLKIKIKPMPPRSPIDRKRKASFQANLQEGCLKLKIKKVGAGQPGGTDDSGNLPVIAEQEPSVFSDEENCETISNQGDGHHTKRLTRSMLVPNTTEPNEEQNVIKSPVNRGSPASANRASPRLVLNMATKTRETVDETRRVTRSASVNQSVPETPGLLEELELLRSQNAFTYNYLETQKRVDRDSQKTDVANIQEQPPEKRERLCLKISKAMLLGDPLSKEPGESEIHVSEITNQNCASDVDRQPLKFSIPLSKLPAVYSTWKPVDKLVIGKRNLYKHRDMQKLQAAQNIVAHYSRLRRLRTRKQANALDISAKKGQLSSCDRDAQPNGYHAEEVMSECDSAVVDMVCTPESLQHNKMERVKETHSEEDQGIGMESDETNSPGAHSDSSICGAMGQTNKLIPQDCSIKTNGVITSPESIGESVYPNDKWRKSFVTVPEGEVHFEKCNWPENPIPNEESGVKFYSDHDKTVLKQSNEQDCTIETDCELPKTKSKRTNRKSGRHKKSQLETETETETDLKLTLHSKTCNKTEKHDLLVEPEMNTCEQLANVKESCDTLTDNKIPVFIQETTKQSDVGVAPKTRQSRKKSTNRKKSIPAAEQDMVSNGLHSPDLPFISEPDLFPKTVQSAPDSQIIINSINNSKPESTLKPETNQRPGPKRPHKKVSRLKKSVQVPEAVFDTKPSKQEITEISKEVSANPITMTDLVHNICHSEFKETVYEKQLSPKGHTMADLISDVCASELGLGPDKEPSKISKPTGRSSVSGYVGDECRKVSESDSPRKRNNSGKNTAKDWLASLNNHDKSRTKSKSSPEKSEEPLINMWQAPSSPDTNQTSQENSSNLFRSSLPSAGKLQVDTFGAFATKTNNFQSFADLSRGKSVNSVYKLSDSESDFEDFEPPALKVPVKKFMSSNSNKDISQGPHNSDFLHTIGLQRQSSSKSNVGMNDHFENEFLKFINKHDDGGDLSDVFDEDGDDAMSTNSDAVSDSAHYGSTCVCARFLNYFDKNQFMHLSEELVYLRHKICEMIVALFPEISYSGTFDITSSDVEDLIDAIMAVVSDKPPLDLAKLPPTPRKQLKIVLCKTPSRCLNALRKKATEFLKVLFPQVSLGEEMCRNTDSLQHIMEEIVINNKVEDM